MMIPGETIGALCHDGDRDAMTVCRSGEQEKRAVV
jgi:hypothetical protein